MSFREQLIGYQNKAERDFKDNKTFLTVGRYALAIGIFMVSTYVAGIRLILTMPFKVFNKKKIESDPSVHWVNQSNVEKILKENKVVLLDIWAEWCGPCIMMEPVINKFAEQPNNIYVGKVNADTNPRFLKKYQIKGLPHILLFKNGEEVKRFAGAMTLNELNDFTEL